MKLIQMAIRSLLRTPGFTLVAVLALALGIGANTAIFSLVNGVFLRALPYADPQSLVQLSSTLPEQQINGVGFSWGRMEAVAERQDVFSAMAVTAPMGFTVTGDGDPEQVQGLQVSQSFFPLLGIPPALGRTFLPEEDQPGAAPVAVLSHAFWERRLGARADAIGRSLVLDGQAHTIIGVMPKSISAFPMNQVAVWTARPKEVSYLVPVQIDNGGYFFNVLARLKPGVTLEQARQSVSDHRRGLRPGLPHARRRAARARHGIPACRAWSATSARPTALLFAAVAWPAADRRRERGEPGAGALRRPAQADRDPLRAGRQAAPRDGRIRCRERGARARRRRGRPAVREVEPVAGGKRRREPDPARRRNLARTPRSWRSRSACRC